jgi:putative copper export protein
MNMPQSLRKLMLIVHITASVGWIGAAGVFLALAIIGLTSPELHKVRAVYLALEIAALYVIVPLSLCSLVSGLVQSLGTSWGLFRHYWVLVKFLLTVFAAFVLLLQIEPIQYIADAAMAATFSVSDMHGARMSLILHSGGGILVLLVAMVLSVYKPRGITRYGWRKQNE